MWRDSYSDLTVNMQNKGNIKFFFTEIEGKGEKTS